MKVVSILINSALMAVLATVTWFFWIEPLFLKDDTHPRMTLFNAARENEALKQWNEQVARESGGSTELTIPGLEGISNEQLAESLNDAIGQLCSRPEFSERFGISESECVKRTRQYFDKCRHTLMDDFMTILQNPDAVVEKGTDALKCSL